MADRPSDAERRLRGHLARTLPADQIDRLIEQLRADERAATLREAGTKLLTKYSVTCVTRHAADFLRRMADQIDTTISNKETDPP